MRPHKSYKQTHTRSPEVHLLWEAKLRPHKSYKQTQTHTRSPEVHLLAAVAARAVQDALWPISTLSEEDRRSAVAFCREQADLLAYFVGVREDRVKEKFDT